MAKSVDIQVVLVRSGRTEWDDDDRLQGRTDLPLSESGRESTAALLRELALSLVPPGPGLIYCGPDEACLQTAQLLALDSGAKIKPVDDLAAMDLGVWDGLLDSQLMDRFPTAHRQWKEEPASVNPPEGETFDEAEARIRLSMCRLLDRANGKPIAFVLRPVPYALGVCWLAGRPTNELWAILDDGPQAHRLSVPRELVRATMQEIRAGA